MRVPGQRRLAIFRLRVPNLDGFVDTAAGDLFFIGTQRHRKDPEIVRSQDTNQQKHREKNREKLTRPSARSPSTRSVAKKLKNILIKKLTLASARSASTGNLQIASPKS